MKVLIVQQLYLGVIVLLGFNQTRVLGKAKITVLLAGFLERSFDGLSLKIALLKPKVILS